MILGQIRRYKHEYNMKYSGMKLTIEYCTKYLDPPVIPIVQFGLSFIPQYYEAAKQHYIARRNIEQHLKSIDVTQVTNQIRTVQINEQDRIEENRNRLIDLSEMEGGDDD